MTLAEAIEKVELAPEYIQAIYNNKFEIEKYNKSEYEEPGGMYHSFEIDIPVKIARKTYTFVIEWGDFDDTFYEGVFRAVRHFNTLSIVKQYIASVSDDDMCYEYLEDIVEDGRSLLNAFYKLEDAVFSIKDKLWEKKCEERRQKEREERLSNMTPEERKRAELEEKVFDELSESLMFKMKMEQAQEKGYDSEYKKKFEDWVEEEVNWRVNNILENENE